MSRTSTFAGSILSPLARPVPRELEPALELTVLCYHDVVSQQPAPGEVGFNQFRAQLDLLEKEHLVIEAGRAVDAIREGRDLGRGRVVLTFDDGLRGAIELAVPEMESRGLPYTIFVIADKARSPLEPSYASTERIMELVETNGTIGAHGRSHEKPLTEVSDDELITEIESSLEFLRELERPRPWLFCYPWAAYDTSVERACRAAGFDAAFAGQWSRFHTPSSLYRIGRVTIDHDDDLRTFRMKLEGARDIQARWLAWRRSKLDARKA